LTRANSDVETAYADAGGRVNTDPERINLGAGLLGGPFGGATTPLTTGVYTFSTGVSLTGDIYIRGSSADIFIIQIAGDLIQAANMKVILEGGALAKNIFWQVAGLVTVGAGAHMEGVLLVQKHVIFMTGSSLNGRIFAQTACVLQIATITQPALFNE
jgi:hypothetical protein